MRSKFIITLNVMIVAAMVIGNMAMLAPAAYAQEEVLLPMMSSNGAAPVVEIDIKGINDPVKEVRSGTNIPVGKEQGAFGGVTTYDDMLVPATTPLSVRLLASGVPKVNEAIAIELQVHAYEAAPNTKAEIVLPDGVELVEGTIKAQFDLAAGQTRSLNAAIAFRQTGEYEIVGTAKSVISVDEGTVYGDMDQLFMTVGSDVSAVGVANLDMVGGLEVTEGPDVPAEAAAAEAEEGEAVLIATSYFEGMDDVKALALDLEAAADPAVNQEDPSAPVLEADSGDEGPAQAAHTRTINFCWRLRDRAGSNSTTVPMRDAYYQIWDQDGSIGGSNDDLLGTGYLSYYGGCASKSVSDHDGAGTADVYIKVFLSHGGRYRVATNGGTTWWGRSSTKWNISGTTNFGTLNIGHATRGDGRALALYNDLYLVRRTINQFRGGLGGDPGYVRIKWQSGSNDGTYYSLSNKWVHLKDADVKSPDTVVHEAAHDIMDNLYAGWPISDCPSPHYIDRVSGKGCAWSEGWTYVIVALVNGDPVYKWPSGGTLNLETPHCTSAGWSDGPAVEGRVGGVLIDLMDPIPFSVPRGPVSGMSNEKTGCYEDETSGMFDIVWDAIYDQDDKVFVKQGGVTDSFSNAWESRQNPRYFPHRVGHHNSISTFTHD